MATYKRIEEIGTGGFGVVYRCQREEDEKVFALKKLQTKDPNAMKRFEREVRIVSSLDHPNIIKIITKRLDEHGYFYVMPLYSHTLQTIMAEIKGNEQRVVSIFSSILDGLEYAHKQGVIHRDLKPANILMNDDVDIVVSDFGLGRQFDSQSTRATYTGTFLGTPLYMAPEQVDDSKNSDCRADIFSLGRILYEMYYGHITTGFQDNSKLPPAIQLVVSRCTQHNPDDRYQSVTELKQMWNSIFDIQKSEVEIGQFALLRADPNIDDNAVKQLITMFAKFIQSKDDLHDALMNTEPIVLEKMYSDNSEFVRKLLFDYCEFTTYQGWSFGYTDKIGNWCFRVFNVIMDAEIRANLLHCVMEVGRCHNRWRVLEYFGEMLKKVQGDEALVVREKLGGIPKPTRMSVSAYIPGGILPILVELFQSDDESE